jgi:flavin-dependent dehydrogenase
VTSEVDVDVAIVGGGPAGTSTALHLVRAEGIDPSRVAIVEKGRHPRDKPCAGAVSAWGVVALSALGVRVDVPHVAMRGLRVLAGDVTGAHDEALGVVVRRCEFDGSLWRHATSDGVRGLEGEPLVDLARCSGGWRLRTAGPSISARFVAACDGAGSTVRKLLRIPEAARKGHLYVAETRPVPADVGPRAGLCDFDLRVADDGVEGYYWDFPAVVDGLSAVNRGIYHANFNPRRDLKQDLLRSLAARGVDAGGVRLKPFSTRPFVPGAPLAFDRLALVGEAAGIDATTGEGIAQAILTGAIAARHLARGLRGGDASLAGYAAEVTSSRVGRHMLQSAWLARRVYGRGGAAWRRFLAGNAGARAAGAGWFSGKELGWQGKVRLGASLAVGLAAP